jgi:hypothetical protein
MTADTKSPDAAAPAAETAVVKAFAITGEVNEVVMHPLVLLSAADHYHRVARGTRKRVVGVLLGSIHKGNVDATNSFAVPFEEDSRNPVSIYTVCLEGYSGDTLLYPAAVSHTLSHIISPLHTHIYNRRSFIWITITWKTC